VYKSIGKLAWPATSGSNVQSSAATFLYVCLLIGVSYRIGHISLYEGLAIRSRFLASTHGRDSCTSELSAISYARTTISYSAFQFSEEFLCMSRYALRMISHIRLVV
jgi:hypothetical protein